MNKKAFTLIELLVVVLIIGILAAIALPKYELAVEKSRLAEALTMASSLQKAIDVYVLENGYPSSGTLSFLGDDANGNGSLVIDLSNLDCSAQNGFACASKNFTYRATCISNGWCFVDTTSLRFSYNLSFAKLDISDAWRGNECDYSSDDPIGEKICKQLNTQNPGEFDLCQDC